MNLSSIDSILNGGITTKSSSKGEKRMILYTKSECPLCTVTKVKLNSKNIAFDICTDENEMDKLGIDRLPVLKTDDGELLDFSAIMKLINSID